MEVVVVVVVKLELDNTQDVHDFIDNFVRFHHRVGPYIQIILQADPVVGY